MYHAHNSPVASHAGSRKTQTLVGRTYWWPEYWSNVKRYVDACQECQRNKPDRMARHAPLHPHPVPDQPWDIIGVDLLGPLPVSQGFDAIEVVTDHFSKQIVLIPCNTSLTSEGQARLFRDHVFR